MKSVGRLLFNLVLVVMAQSEKLASENFWNHAENLGQACSLPVEATSGLLMSAHPAPSTDRQDVWLTFSDTLMLLLDQRAIGSQSGCVHDNGRLPAPVITKSEVNGQTQVKPFD
jgi:hypothetical protein